MSHDRYTERLSEYLDDELSAPERRELEQHLDGCTPCRTTLADLRTVIADARALERGEPGRDLWPGIAARIEAERDVVLPLAGTARRRRLSFTVPQLAAASLALILASAGSSWVIGRAVSQADGAPAIETGVRALPASTGIVDDTVDAQIRQLEQMLLAGETQLDPATIAVLRRNLLIIDQALAEARAAMRSDPANPYLNRHYANTVQKKLELLRQAGSIGRGST